MASRHLAQKWSGFFAGRSRSPGSHRPAMTLVLLLPAQEVIEGGLAGGRSRPRRAREPRRPDHSSAPGGRFPQVVCTRVIGPQSVGTFEDPEGTVDLRGSWVATASARISSSS